MKGKTIAIENGPAKSKKAVIRGGWMSYGSALNRLKRKYSKQDVPKTTKSKKMVLRIEFLVLIEENMLIMLILLHLLDIYLIPFG